nr:4Fe-4S dicluster domain-containing protein [uncultured Pseudodesulfovibrio sp.]
MPYQPRLMESACIRFKGGECTSCADVCPSKAISLSRAPSVAGGLCLSCGACASACPVDAVKHRSTAQLLKKIASLCPTATISVGCFAIPFVPAGMVQLDGCLSAIGLDALAALALADVETIQFVHGHCDKCPKGDHCHLFVKTLRALRTACPDSVEKMKCVLKDSSPQVAANTMTRRGLFNMFGSCKDAVSSPVTADDSFFSHLLGLDSKRVRLHTVFGSLSCVLSVPETVRIAEIEITQSCTGCGACSRICPVNALEFIADTHNFSIRFMAWKCVDCGLCIKSCLSGSIERRPATLESLTNEIPSTLYAGSLKECKRCKVRSTTLKNGYCSICAHSLNL